MMIEYCTNSEWLAAGICDQFDVDHAWLDEVANAYTNEAVRAAESRGVTVEAASGQRIMFHGWNGAQFDQRIGIFGVFGDVDAATKSSLEEADELGYKEAVDLASELSKQLN
jgi:hypothetical protein